MSTHPEKRSADDEIVKVTEKILRRRIASSPIPTQDSRIDDDMPESLGPQDRPFIAITIPQGARAALQIGVAISHLFDAASLDAARIQALDRLADRFGFDTVLVPCCKKIDPRVIEAPSKQSSVRLIQLTTPRPRRNLAAEEFHFISDVDQATLFSSNLLAQDIIRNLRKVSHILLSNIAAPSYDKKYQKSSVGTEYVMLREEEIVEDLVSELGQHRCLVELGCGTGRHALKWAHKFARVVGYDFSKGMVQEASQNKDRARQFHQNSKSAIQNLNNVEFLLRDVEMYPVVRDILPAPVDCVLGLFGMGSFVEDLPRSIQSVHAILESGGRVAFSFYNKDAATYSYPPPWRHTSLSAALEASREELRVQLPSGQRFSIFCRPYSADSIMRVFGLYFQSIRLRSFPVVCGLLPPDYITNAKSMAQLRRGLFEADRAIEKGVDGVHFGNYFVVSGQKLSLQNRGWFAPSDWENLIRPGRVSGAGAGFQIVEVVDHEETRDASSMRRFIPSGDSYYKGALYLRADHTSINGPQPVMVVSLAEERIERPTIERIVGGSKSLVRLASPGEVQEIFGGSDFPLPFLGLSEDVRLMAHESLEMEKPFWMSGGTPTRSIKVKLKSATLRRIERFT